MKLLLAFLMSAICFDAAAQLKLPVKAVMPVKKEVQAVAADFYTGLGKTRGEIEFDSPSQIIYTSKIIPRDAIKCVIISFPTFNNHVWEAKLLQTESFEEAAKLYQNVFKQLQKTKVDLAPGISLPLIAEFVPADERRSFSTTVFHVEDEEERYKNFHVEVSMSYTFPAWEVGLRVYEKASDADIRPLNRTPVKSPARL